MTEKLFWTIDCVLEIRAGLVSHTEIRVLKEPGILKKIRFIDDSWLRLFLLPSDEWNCAEGQQFENLGENFCL